MCYCDSIRYNDPVKLQVEGKEKRKQTICREINGRKVYFDIMGDPNTIKKENLWYPEYHLY
jgi:hypothetical protein